MNTLIAETAADWRDWLDRHGESETEVWLVLPHRNSGLPGPRYAEAVEHALCYGWIDGLHRKRDEHSSQLRFSPRTARSNWSRLNRERAEAMIERGLMTPRGQERIDAAHAAGTWDRATPAPRPRGAGSNRRSPATRPEARPAARPAR